MNTRRNFIKAMAAALALPLVARARPREVVLNYKGPACDCCGEWEKHMRANGFRVESRKVDDMDAIKRRYGVRDDLVSCHTALVGGYVIEGHVPASDVRRLLKEKSKVIGLTIPGMPASAPGMDGKPHKPYEVLAFDAGRAWVFERH